MILENRQRPHTIPMLRDRWANYTLTLEAYMRTISALLLFAVVANGQSVKLPDKVQGEPGQFIQIPSTTDCAAVKWFSPDKGLNVFPVQLLKDTKTAVVSGPVGTYRLYAYGAKGDVASDPVLCLIVIGTPDPTPGPGPGPKPPEPTPPAPIPVDGFRVLFVVESSDASKLTAAQLAILTSGEIRTYLNSKCVVGPDGKTKEWRQWDKDVDTSAESQLWQAAMKRPRSSLPWIVISDGKTGFEGPLPATIADTLAILKKYGDK